MEASEALNLCSRALKKGTEVLTRVEAVFLLNSRVHWKLLSAAKPTISRLASGITIPRGLNPTSSPETRMMYSPLSPCTLAPERQLHLRFNSHDNKSVRGKQSEIIHLGGDDGKLDEMMLFEVHHLHGTEC